MKIRSTLLTFLIGGMCANAQLNLQVSGVVTNTGGASVPVQITTGPGTLPPINATLFTNAAGSFSGTYGMSTSSGTVIATLIACDSSTVSSSVQYFDTLGFAFANFQMNYCNNSGALDCLGIPNGSALPGTACVDTFGVAGIWSPNCVCITGGGQVDCLGNPGGSALPGTACVDSAGVQGIWNPNCVCVPNGGQVDCLGIPGGNALPGTTCVTSTGTIGIWDQLCNCIPNQGQVDCLGVPGGNALPGTACTDSSGVTGTWSPNCICITGGGQVDCLGVPGGNALPGTACTDTSGVAGVWDANCNCITGQGQVDCLGNPGGTALPGTACVDSTGNQGTWDQFCNCVAGPNSIGELDEAITAFVLAPNPANEFLNILITSKQPGIGALEVLDVTGKLVIQQGLQLNTGESRIELNTSDLLEGVYLIKVETHGQTSIKRFAKVMR